MPEAHDDLDAVRALAEPTRRRLYELVAAARGPVTRDEASDALDLDRSLVAYHLDKLVEEGLLEASFARPDGRGGPGAGRPAKRYERGDRELAVTYPPRDYRLLAEVFARAAERDDQGRAPGPVEGEGGQTVRQAVEGVAREVGAELAEAAAPGGGLRVVLERLGFEPFDDGGVTRLGNCPFHRLAREHTELVCGVNLALFQGLVRALAAPDEPRLEPHPDRCCVVLERSTAAAPDGSDRDAYAG